MDQDLQLFEALPKPVCYMWKQQRFWRECAFVQASLNRHSKHPFSLLRLIWVGLRGCLTKISLSIWLDRCHQYFLFEKLGICRSLTISWCKFFLWYFSPTNYFCVYCNSIPGCLSNVVYSTGWTTVIDFPQWLLTGVMWTLWETRGKKVTLGG